MIAILLWLNQEGIDRLLEKEKAEKLSSLHSVREDVIANFDAKAYRPKDDYRILVATEVLAEGVNLHRSNVVINYDIPRNPTRVIQMLGADARLLTEGEEIVSHDLFARWNSKKTITGEDEDEETELKFPTEIRTLRDKQPDLFERIKRLPKKARSTRTLPVSSSLAPTGREGRGEGAASADGLVKNFPALLTYFRQGKIEKFFLGASGSQPTAELDFMTAAKILKPADLNETRQSIPREFYDLLDKNKGAFVTATTADAEQAASTHRGSPNSPKRTRPVAWCHNL